MSHVAEGELHAWLDGALDQLGERRAQQVREHLRRCASCRERRAAEEALRARAAEVLAMATPRAGEALPLEALLERAKRVPPPEAARSTRGSGLARLGWAASVLIALGAGWTGRELWLRSGREAGAPGGDRTATRVAVESPTAAVSEPAPLVEAIPGPVAAPPPASPPVPVNSVPAERGSVLAEGPADGSPLESASAAAGAGAEASGTGLAVSPAPVVLPPRVETIQASGPEAAAPGNASASATPVFAAAEPPRAARDQIAAVEANGERTPARPVAGRQERAAFSSVPQPGSIGIQRAPAGAAADVPDLFVQGRARRAQPNRAPQDSGLADPDEALDLLVPELKVLHVEWAEVVPGQRGLKVEQLLASGDTLEIRFVRSGGAAADAAANPLATVVGATLPEGWSQVIQVHGDGWIVARARLPRPELETLIRGVGTGRR